MVRAVSLASDSMILIFSQSGSSRSGSALAQLAHFLHVVVVDRAGA
jgi:hypothetical protein